MRFRLKNVKATSLAELSNLSNIGKNTTISVSPNMTHSYETDRKPRAVRNRLECKVHHRSARQGRKLYEYGCRANPAGLHIRHR